LNIIGLSLGGGKNENFYFCHAQYYAENKRWFLNLQVNNEKNCAKLNDDFLEAINSKKIESITFDFPLNGSFCHSCKIECPGEKKCSIHDVKTIRHMLNDILQIDSSKIYERPKEYEKKRLEFQNRDFMDEFLRKKSSDHILSRSFKKKLKKGFNPYWNRGIDFWVWCEYYDLLLKYFNISYESYGNLSYGLLSRYFYLKKHLPSSIKLWESHPMIILLELFLSEILDLNSLNKLKDHRLAPLAKIEIIRKLEKIFDLFIYEHDLEKIVRFPRAFHSILLCVAGMMKSNNKTRKLPEWALNSAKDFYIPSFL
jgi:hypothetical protein